MNGRRVGLAFLIVLAAILFLGPLTGLLHPPNRPYGPSAARLAPGSAVTLVTFQDGRTQAVTEFESLPDDTVDLTIGRLKRNFAVRQLAGGSWESAHRRTRFVLGTDDQGRDLLSRWVHGGRRSLVIGLAGALIALVIGGSVGATAGYAGGWVDGLLMRATDVTLAFPAMFLALLITGLWEPSVGTTIAVLASTTWMGAARLARAETQAARARPFTQAARVAGAGPWRLATRHLLPAAWPALATETTLRIGDTILLESALSFLGVGVGAPLASWGNMIADGRNGMLDAWWIATIPGVSIVLTVLAFHALGTPSGRADRSSGRTAAGTPPYTAARCATSGTTSTVS